MFFIGLPMTFLLWKNYSSKLFSIVIWKITRIALYAQGILALYAHISKLALDH